MNFFDKEDNNEWDKTELITFIFSKKEARFIQLFNLPGLLQK